MAKRRGSESGVGVQLADLDMDRRFEGSKKKYEKRLAELQFKMLRIQQAYHHQGRRAVLVFEGWDASGKGGSTRRLTEQLDPRGFVVHPIAAPAPEPQGVHYLARFWRRLPHRGRIAIFDRSWYGRVMVERVEGFASPREWKRAYREINDFERLLVDDGVRVLKFFLHTTEKEQARRFSQRLMDPYKRWKLTPEDLRNREKRPGYEEAIESMFKKTSTVAAPWHAIEANHKWYARIRVLEIATEALSEGVDISAKTIDPDFLRRAASLLGVDVD